MNMHKIKTGAYMALIFIPVVLIVLWEERRNMLRWLLVICLLALMLSSCTEPDDARRILASEGYTGKPENI